MSASPSPLLDSPPLKSVAGAVRAQSGSDVGLEVSLFRLGSLTEAGWDELPVEPDVSIVEDAEVDE